MILPFKASFSNKKVNKKQCYLYRIIGEGFDTYGIIGLLHHDLFANNKILAHEQTIKDKESAYIKSLLTEKKQFNPIVLFYKEQQSLKILLQLIESTGSPIFNVMKDNTRHLLYTIDDKAIFDAVKNELVKLDRFYIADGHHRVQASLKSAAKDETLPKYCLSMLVSEDSLKVGSISRCIKRKLNGDLDSLLDAIREKFYLEDYGNSHSENENYKIFMKGHWYRLTLKEELVKSMGTLDKLPPFVLDSHLLKSIFSISNQTESEVLDFTPHNISIEKRLAVGDSDIAICPPALSIKELCQIADSGRITPPHSTYLQPKVLDRLISWEFNSE